VTAVVTFFIVKIVMDMACIWFNGDKWMALYLTKSHGNILENFIFRAFVYGMFELTFTASAYSY